MSTGTSRLSAADRREQLLAVALKVFAQRGYHSTSMNDIADAAGVTKPVLYQHFDSKRALYTATLEAVGESMIAALTSATSASPSGKEQTAAGMVAYFRWVADDPDAFSLIERCTLHALGLPRYDFQPTAPREEHWTIIG